MSFEAVVALAVLVILFALIVAIVLWIRSAPPYDDGMGGGGFVSYLPEPDDPTRLPGEPRRAGTHDEGPRPGDDEESRP